MKTKTKPTIGKITVLNDKIKIPEDVAHILLRINNQKTKKRAKQWRQYLTEMDELFKKHNLNEFHSVLSIKKLCFFLEVFGGNKRLFQWFKKLSPRDTQRVAHHFVPPYMNADEIWPNVCRFPEVLERT